MHPNTGIQAYASVGLETGVTIADPHKLILLLYQGALLAISSAKNQMLRKEIAAKGKSISHAIRIIDEGLKASLDKNTGGELAQNLSALYDYMNQRLLIANIKDEVAALDEVSRLLIELKTAWEEIGQLAAPDNASAQPEAARQSTATQTAKQVGLTYGRI
ncbi:MAG: flagellar export chaperone FliS [Pseudomonadota bacterium]